MLIIEHWKEISGNIKLWLVVSRIFEDWILFKYLNIVQMFELIYNNYWNYICVYYALFE